MADDSKKNPLGPTGRRTAANVARFRASRNLTYAELSRRLHDLGRPIPTLGLSRIEQGERRIDVDDLIALSLALDTNPTVLMFLDDRGMVLHEEVELTPARSMLYLDLFEWSYQGRDLWRSDEQKQALRAVVEKVVDERLAGRAVDDGS